MVNLNPRREDRYSQVNNILRPMSACFATSAIECLDIRKHDVGRMLAYAAKVNSVQPEDGLGWFLSNDPEVQENWRKWHPTDLGTPAYLWADCMAFAINKIFGQGVAAFVPDLTFNKIVAYLDRGIPSCFSGRYDGIPGHYVSAVGYNDHGLIVNDPYGWTLRYGISAGMKSNEGFNVIYDRDAYDKVSKNYGLRIE
jgi:hypothetical protein